MFRTWITLVSLFGAVGVALAAWSSHGLASFIPAEQLAVAAERARAASLHHLLHATGHVEQPGPGAPNEFRLFGPENLPGEGSYLDAPLKAPVERLQASGSVPPRAASVVGR